MILNLRVVNNSLLGYHFNLTEDKVQARLTTDTPALSSELALDNAAGFKLGSYALVGTFGEPTAEIVRIHSGGPIGVTALPLNTSTKTVFDHPLDTPVTLLDYNTVQFWQGTVTPLTQLASGQVPIQANRMSTPYTLAAGTTDKLFYRFFNSSTSDASAYSDGVLFTGNPDNSVETVALSAVELTGGMLDDEYCREDTLIRDAQEAQDKIQAGRDWDFELADNIDSIATAESQVNYPMSELTYPLKYPNSKQGLITMRLGNRSMDYVDIQALEDSLQWSASSPLAVDAEAGDTSVTLVDSSAFQAVGTVLLGANGFVAYTANDRTTGTLSGISVVGITVPVSAGVHAWQNVSTGWPARFTIFNGELLLDTPPSTIASGMALKMKYLRRLPRLTSFSSVIEIPFFRILQYYIAYKIQLRKKNIDEAAKLLELWSNHLAEYYTLHKLQQGISQRYYSYMNSASDLVDSYGNPMSY